MLTVCNYTSSYISLLVMSYNVMYEFIQHRMLKMVRKHLSRKYVVQEEELLERIAESSDKGNNFTVFV